MIASRRLVSLVAQRSGFAAWQPSDRRCARPGAWYTPEGWVAAEWRGGHPAVPAAQLSGADVFYEFLHVVGDHHRLQGKNIE